jgi:hypothetical protein
MYVRSMRRIKIREISTKQLEENRRELREGAWSSQCEALRLLSRRASGSRCYFRFVRKRRRSTLTRKPAATAIMIVFTSCLWELADGRYLNQAPVITY